LNYHRVTFPVVFAESLAAGCERKARRGLNHGFLFDRFNGKKEGTLWYYHAISASFRQNRQSNIELIDELDRVVAELESLAG
jgi:hypothetical protein